MKKNTQNGFTIVELSIAMAFVSILLLMIVSIVIPMTGIYQKGLTLRYMDQKGRELSELIIRDIRASRDSSNVRGDTSNVRYGYFCTAISAYFWVRKSGDDSIPNLRVTDTTSPYAAPQSQNNRLIRVSGLNITSSPTCGFTVGTVNAAVVDVTVNSTPLELLPTGTNADIVIQTISRINPTNSGTGDLHCPDGQTWDSDLGGCIDLSGNLTGDVRIQSNYVPMLLVLSTLRGNTSTTLGGDGKCAVDSAIGLRGQYNYCALNKFEFGARIGARQ